LDDREARLRGEKAQAILESPLWLECWDLYEQRLMQEFQNCRTDDVSRMQQIKMLLLAGKAAKSHLEAILKDGEFAAKNIEFQEQSRLKKVANLLRK
jgi:hypothetical protein